MVRISLLVASVGVSVLLAGCGAGGEAVGDAAPVGSDGAVSGGVAGMCIEGATECVDTVVGDDPMPIDETGIKQLRRDAKFYLGVAQDELPDTVRIGRIDDEQMMLTEDYRLGRITVELDDVEGNGTPIVTSSTVELPDGPETFTLED